MVDGLTLGPRSVERPSDAGWVVVGTLDGGDPARVDGGGLVTPSGAQWSLDWWIGADDRWYFPAREPSVRQRRIGSGPVIETTVRIPSGDARQIVYGALVDQRQVTVVEIHNDSPVPVALALAIRPYALDRSDRPSGIRSMQIDGRLVRVDACPVLCLPREPRESGASAAGDMADQVAVGGALTWEHSSRGQAPNGVLLYPLPHRTSLRFLILSSDSDRKDQAEPQLDPALAPEAEAVARGWTAVIDGGCRFEFPDPGLTDLMGAARSRVMLAAPRLADDLVSMQPGAGATLAALAIGGHHAEAGVGLNALAAAFPAKLLGPPSDVAEIVEGVTDAALLSGVEPRPELLEASAQLTHLADRRDSSEAAIMAKRALAGLARISGDSRGADELERGLPPHDPDGGIDRFDAATTMATEASPAATWWGSGEGVGDDVAMAGRFVRLARSLLVDDRGDDLLLLPVFPAAWRGGEVEVHQAPTRHGILSFAIRWHGYRPALLWQLDGADVTIRCPGLDPDWASTDARGETLLTGSDEALPDAPGPGDSFV